jgi:uroporphyrinogen-III synthase
MRVLVTRPHEDALETQILLGARGHEAIVAPLLEVRFRDGPEIDLAGVQAIVATSANGVRALARRTARRDLPVFAVGPQTAQAAQAAGFANVKNADGDADALAIAIPLWTSAAIGELLHATGAEGAGRLAKALATAGFKVRTEVLYDVLGVSELTRNVAAEFAADRIDAVMLLSPRSASTFVQCIERAGLRTQARRVIAACISEATAAAIASLNLDDVRVAARPNQASLLACLD